MFKIEITPSAEKFIRKCNEQVRERITNKIGLLATDPFPRDVKRIQGKKAYRIRVGDYRIVYAVDHEKNNIIITNIDKRERIYSSIHDEEEEYHQNP